MNVRYFEPIGALRAYIAYWNWDDRRGLRVFWLDGYCELSTLSLSEVLAIAIEIPSPTDEELLAIARDHLNPTEEP